jgi:hypothetical protein
MRTIRGAGCMHKPKPPVRPPFSFVWSVVGQGAPSKKRGGRGVEVEALAEPVGCFYVGLRFFGLFCKVLLSGRAKLGP